MIAEVFSGRKIISDAAHRGETAPKRGKRMPCKKPTYISRLLRGRRGSLPPYAAEAGGALVWL